MARLKKAAVIIAMSIELMATKSHAAMLHPLIVGLNQIEFVCVVEAPRSAANIRFETAFCDGLSHLINKKLGVPVVRKSDTASNQNQPLPRVGIVWIRSVVQLRATAAIAHTAWGSYMPQRGVPEREDGSPVTLRYENSQAETIGRALAGAVVDTLPFIQDR